MTKVQFFPVLVRTLTGATESYPAWSALRTTTRRYGLGQVRWLDGTGRLGGNPSTGWSKSLPDDLDTVANGGIPILTNGLASLTGQLPTIWLPTVDRYRAGVWAADRPSIPLRIRGIPQVHLNLSGTAARGTLVAYLYDLDPFGNAS